MPSVLGSGRGQRQEHALPEVSVKGGQGEAEKHTKSGKEKAKGGEEMTREEVVQAALTVERWCKEHRSAVCKCDCPFQFDAGAKWGACKLRQSSVVDWNLEEFLRTRGLKHDD